MRATSKSDKKAIQECSKGILDANNELSAIAELMDVKGCAAGLEMSEWGRAGLASILYRISEKIAAANCELPLSCFCENQPGENGDE